MRKIYFFTGLLLFLAAKLFAQQAAPTPQMNKEQQKEFEKSMKLLQSPEFQACSKIADEQKRNDCTLRVVMKNQNVPMTGSATPPPRDTLLNAVTEEAANEGGDKLRHKVKDFLQQELFR